MGLELTDLFTEAFQREIENSFAYSTGFGVVCVDRDGKNIGRGSNFCRFCAMLNDDPIDEKYCMASNLKAIALALEQNQPSIFICHAGLVNIEIPLIYEGECLGAITAGQVLCDDITDCPRDEASHKIDWLSNPKYAESYKQIIWLPRQQIEAAMISLHNISRYIMQTVAYGRTQQELLLYEKRQIELEHQLKLAELDALQKQVTPHFIFNVINSVARLISLGEYNTAETMLHSFAQMMRYALSDIQSSITLRQELDYINSYLAIQKMRFRDRIRYRIECDSVIEQIAMPFFSLQPLVENSIEHGLLCLEGGGELILTCKQTPEGCEIILADNGIGIPEAELKEIQTLLYKNGKRRNHHVGLYNSYHRLRHLFQSQMNFSIDSTLHVGTTIRIRIAINRTNRKSAEFLENKNPSGLSALT